MSAATTYTFTGSTSGTPHIAITYTVSLGAGTDAGVVITPATTGTGVFAPTSVSLSTGTPTLTFTYTPSALDHVSAPTLSTTNNGALTDPSSIVLTVANDVPATNFQILTWNANVSAYQYNIYENGILVGRTKNLTFTVNPTDTHTRYAIQAVDYSGTVLTKGTVRATRVPTVEIQSVSLT